MIDPRNPDYQNTPAASGRAVFGYRPASIPARPEVSVITPYYNAGAVFCETARSMMGQTLQNWEWIIANDCSTDSNSIKVLDSYRRLDPRIRVIDVATNSGPGAARNAAIRESRAGLIFQLDADDLIEPTALEKCAWYLKTRPEVSFVKGYSVGFGSHRYLWRQGFHSRRKMLQENLVTITTMLRRDLFEEVGGYDESLRSGLEDWEFWIRCASKGRWGSTIPEFLDWYRRRDSHTESWPQWDGSKGQESFAKELAQKYPELYNSTTALGAPEPYQQPFENVRRTLPLSNKLVSDRPGLLLVVPWLRMGGSDKWNLDLVRQLTGQGWRVTIATTIDGTITWAPEFARHTPDIHALHNFVREADFPAYLRYLIESRKPDVVMLSNSWHAYHYLPFLRAVCPEPAYVDFNHMEEEWWHNGGHPRRGVGMQDQLDLNIVISEHLKQWMVARGADPSRIEVSYCNVDHEYWTRNPEVRTDVRCELGIGTDESVILFAGRLCAQKQPNVLAKTLLRVAQSGKQFTAIIAGDGPDSPWLRSFVAEHKMASQVKLLGEVSSDRVRDLMSAADIYFLPSSWEGIALSFYEAMSMELAVVGAIVGGQLELVTPDCGILLPKADEDTEITAYPDAIGSLMAEPARIKALGRTARDRIKTQFTLDQMGDRMIELFDEARRFARDEPRQRLSPGLARELATQAVEFFRLNHIADELWMQRDQATKERAKLSTELQRLRRAAESAPRSPQAALSELAEIESSRAWRAVLGLKRTPVYRVIGHMRYGPDWNHTDPNEHPEARLARIKNSNAYRCIARIKSTRSYRFYASMKHSSTPR